MQHFEGQYFGAALQAFVHGLASSATLVQQILEAHGLKAIEADRWYDLNLARSIYYTVGRQVGERSLFGVGLQMIDAAPFPPGIQDVRGVLASLDHAYHMNVRGPAIGSITAEFEGEYAAIVTFSTPFPCALCRGIVQGCCRKFVASALLEHGPGGCVDTGAPACTFHVAW